MTHSPASAPASMPASAACLAVALALAAVAATGGAVRCYRCAMDDPHCGGPNMDLSEVATENCSLYTVASGLTESVGSERFDLIEREAGIGSFSLPEATAAAIPLGCLKLERRVEGTSGEVSTARHCIWLGHDAVDACAAIRQHADVTFCAICDYDLCNAAGLPRAPAGALLVVLSATAALLQLWK